MTVSHIELGLRMGDGMPDLVPSAVLRALRAVEVTQSDSAPSGFQLSFHTEMSGGGAPNFDLVQNPLLAPFSRVLVRVSVDGLPTTLLDGFVTHQQFAPSNGPEDSVFVLTGEDVSVKMDLIDYSREFPALPDYLIALEVLAPWIVLGIVPNVVPTPAALVPVDHVPQQAGTDRQTLQRLAEQQGNVFYVSPGDALFQNTAYWGPPPTGGPPSATLNVASGPASNVLSFRAQYHALAPVTYYGYVMETSIDPYVPVPVITFTSTRLPALAASPALNASSIVSSTTRRVLWRDQALDPARAITQAQASTDASTDAVVTASAEVATTGLGTVLRAPGVVAVRGAGADYDGLYYLKAVTHRIELLANEQWDYRQSLTLTREGVGSTVATLMAP
jgi:hypothetical protein